MDFTKILKDGRLLGILYLSLPILIFFFYLKNILSIIGIVSLILILIKLFKCKGSHYNINKKTIVLSLVFALSLTFLCGGASWFYGIEQLDWYKHNIILNELIKYDWPVVYNSQEALNYYFAFYLPSALFGKLTHSFIIAKIFLSFWIMLGLFLGFMNLLDYININKKVINSFTALITFSFYSGWDWLHYLIARGRIPLFPIHIEWSAGVGVAQYSSFVTGITWVPQHFIPAFLTVPLVLEAFNTSYLFLIPILFLWSPFVAIGISFIYGISLLMKLIDKERIRVISGIDIILTLLVSLPLIAFFILHSKINLEPHIIIKTLTYIAFITTEIGSLIISLVLLDREIKKEKNLVYLTLIVLIILPLFKFGNDGFNDFVMRTSFPLLITIVIIILKKVFVIQNKLKLIIITLLMGGILTPLYEIGRVMQGQNIYKPAPNIKIIPLGQQNYIGKIYFDHPLLDFLNKPIIKKDNVSH